MKKNSLKILFVLFALAITFIVTIKWLDDINIKLDPDTLDKLIASSSNLNSENKVINSIVEVITNNNYIDPVAIILKKYSANYNSQENNNNDVPVVNEETSPLVYIYNTHQTEKYNSSLDININYSVLDASYLLQEKLKKYNISSVVESGSIKDILDTNNWNYASSYKVSRMYLENAKKNIPSLKYFIDLHRDSVNKKISTVEINGKSYARILFVLGLENINYSENKKVMEFMENFLNTNYYGISRGIFEREGPGVNGVYNQDFSTNCVLIEVGGEYNTTEEVANTIEVIAEMINAYIGESV